MGSRQRLITDGISQLPDEILLKILSFLPTTKDVTSTMVLSKRWKSLWKRVPKLVFDNNIQNLKYRRFSRFVDRSLFLHEAPVLEKLYLKFGEEKCGAPKCRSGDVPLWIRAAKKRKVLELIIEMDSNKISPVTLPRCLYTGYKNLVTLKLSKAVLVGDLTTTVSFPLLRKLSLKSMKYPCDEFFNRLLSNCPVLKDLVVERCRDDNLTILNVNSLHLESLELSTSADKPVDDTHGFVINAPSLYWLDISDDTKGFCIIENDMSKIGTAYVDMSCHHTEQLLGSLTSAKHLRLCSTTSKAYPDGIVFNRLVELELCTCEAEWLNLLMCLLRDSPNLQALGLRLGHSNPINGSGKCWNEPSLVPDCLLSSLETLEWVKYVGAEEEKQVVEFILRNGKCLKKVTIKPLPTLSRSQKFDMLKELSFLPRTSTACQLAFD